MTLSMYNNLYPEKMLPGEWCKFEDRVPPTDIGGESYIVCFREKFYGDKEWRYQIIEGWIEAGGYLHDERYYFGFDTLNDWDEGQRIEFVAWMPFPDAPKEDE